MRKVKVITAGLFVLLMILFAGEISAQNDTFKPDTITYPPDTTMILPDTTIYPDTIPKPDTLNYKKHSSANIEFYCHTIVFNLSKGISGILPDKIHLFTRKNENYRTG